MGRGWKPVRKTELLQSIRIPNNGDLDKKRLGKTEKFYKKYYKKSFLPQNWRIWLEIENVHEMPNTLRPVTETFQMARETEVPMSSNKGSRVRKALAFSTATQKPKTMEKQPPKSGRHSFQSRFISIQTINQVFVKVSFWARSFLTALSIILVPILPHISYSHPCFISIPQHFSLHTIIHILLIVIVYRQSLPLKCKLHEVRDFFKMFLLLFILAPVIWPVTY